MTTSIEQQHMTALALANQIRLARSELRKEIRSLRPYEQGARAFAKLILDPPVCMNSLRVEDALRWVYRMTQTRIQECLEEAGWCSPYKRVGDLSERQRRVIAAWLIESTLTRRGAA